jgi:hypothetical protein
MTTESPLGKIVLAMGALLPWVASLLIDSGETTPETLTWVRGHDTQAYIATVIALAAVPFLILGVLATWNSLRGVNWRLAALAAVALTIGCVGLAAQDGSQALAFSLAGDQKVDLDELAKIIDADKLPLLVAKIGEFGGWLAGLLAAVGALLLATSSSRLAVVSALGLLSVPFTLAIGAFAPAVPDVLLVAGLALMAAPVVLTRFR